MSDAKKGNPFAVLSALKDTLPEGKAASPPVEVAKVDARYAGKLVVAKSKKGRGGKTVTCVRGIVGTAEVYEEVARGLRHALGCGATVSEGEVIVQGEQLERVSAWLREQGARKVVIGN